MFKRYLSILITLALLTCSLPVPALAEAVADPTPTATFLTLPEETAQLELLSSVTTEPTGTAAPANTEEAPDGTENADPANVLSTTAAPTEAASTETAPIPTETAVSPTESASAESEFLAASLTYEDFVYTLEDGVATIIDYTGTEAEVLLPGVIGESTSVVIAADAFIDCAFVEFVYVIDETVSFETGALNGCSDALVLVGLPGSTHEAWAAAEGVAFEPLYVEPESISVKDVTIGVGQSAELEIELLPENAASMIYIALEKEGIVSVSDDGVLTGLKAGTTRLAVMTENEKEAVCTVKVVKAPTSITLSHSTGKLGVGETFQLTYKLTSGSSASVTFSSDNEAAVSVDPATGLITAKGVGTAVITARTHNGKTDTCKVTVSAAPTTLALPEHPETLGVGQKVDLEAVLDGYYYSGVTYTSSNENVLTVNKDGLVTAVGTGSATITAATSFGGLSATADFTVIAATTKVTIPATHKMGVKDTYQLVPVLDEGTTAGLTYTSNYKSVATVDENGLITAKARGTATITVKTHNGKKDTIRVTVVNAPKSIELSHSTGDPGLNETFDLGFTLTKNTAASVTFTSDKPEVVSVDPNTGFCKALSLGTAVITATTHNGLSDSCTVTVHPAPESISMLPETLELGVKMKASVKASINEGSCGRIEYVSSNESVATVDESGNVTAVAEGTVQIIASTYVEGLQAVTNVTVVPAPSSVTIPASYKMGVKDTYQLSPQIPEGSKATFTYTSSRKSVATVDENGLITAKARGTATITVKAQNGKKDTIRITVIAAPKAIELSHSTGDLGLNETFTLKYTVTRNTAASVTFTSDKPEVVSVDPNTGFCKALSLGTAVITATTHNGLSDSCTVTVHPAPVSISVLPETLELGVKMKASVKASINEGSCGRIEYVSSNESVATVDANGNVTAVAEGTVQIIASTYVEGLQAVTNVTVVPAPSSVTIPASYKMGVKDTYQLVPQIPEGSKATFTYTSSRKSVATVDENGLITAKARGTATITVKAQNGKKDTIRITVIAAPKAIELSHATGDLGLNETFTLKYTVTRNTAASVTFTSDKPEVVSVDPNTGFCKALSLGTAVITATTHNGLSDSCTVTVHPAPVSISMLPETLELGVKMKASVKASINEGSCGRIEYVSSNESVATVDANGNVTAVAEGTVQIIASTYVEGLQAVTNVTVVPAPSSVTIPASYKMGVKDTYQLVPQIPEGSKATFTYTSSRKSVATVDENGLITAKARGTATITVKAQNGKKDTIRITVIAAPKAIELSHSTGDLGLNETFTLKYTVTRNTAASVTFTSDKPEVVSVDPNTGFCKALSLGTAVITATTHNGLSDSCTVTVHPAPVSISVLPETLELGVKMKASVKASINEGSCGRIEYVSSNESVATVDASGNVTAVAEGTVQIIASTYVEGLQAVTNVTVVPAPSSVTIPASYKMGVKDTYQLSPQIPEGSKATFTYTSSRKSVATVDENGLITAKARGTATITVKAQNGKKDTIRITVIAAPKSITLSHTAGTLGVAETFQLTYKLSSGTASSVTFTSNKPEVVSIDPKTGLMTGNTTGSAVITATTHNGMTAMCTVTVKDAPTSINIGAAEHTMGVGQTLQLPMTLSEGSSSMVKWSSSNPAAASVDGSGMVKALAAGKTTITAKTHVPGLEASTTITVLPAPNSFVLDPASIELNYGETYQIVPIMAEGFEASFTYATSNKDIASVDANGLITAGMHGTATITVTSHNKKTAKLAVKVYDPNYPDSISFEPLPEFLAIDETHQIKYTVTPATAGGEMTWTSTEPAIATVNDSGVITGVSPGVVTINGVSKRNTSLTISYTLIILGTELSLVIPERRTDIDGIEANLERIRALESSAYTDLDRLYKNGTISQAEYTRRKSAVKNAFEMYAFPWMTEEKEPYWYAGYSENGLKDFKPGVVYFGIPYTQSKRTYNTDKLLDEGYYYESEDGNYYLMDNDKVSSRNYMGNDCSSFVSMAYFGTQHANSYFTTDKIYYNSVYKTIPWDEEMRAGDLLCKPGHVAMFLYYADLAKSQIMIIEQGGGEKGTNTVSASIKKITYYTDRNYIIRRLATFAD